MVPFVTLDAHCSRSISSAGIFFYRSEFGGKIVQIHLWCQRVCWCISTERFIWFRCVLSPIHYIPTKNRLCCFCSMFIHHIWIWVRLKCYAFSEFCWLDCCNRRKNKHICRSVFRFCDVSFVMLMLVTHFIFVLLSSLVDVVSFNLVLLCSHHARHTPYNYSSKSQSFFVSTILVWCWWSLWYTNIRIDLWTWRRNRANERSRTPSKWLH